MNSLAIAEHVRLGSSVGHTAGLPASLRDWLRPALAARGQKAAPLGVRASPAADVAGQADWDDVQASLAGDGEAYARLVDRYQQQIAAAMWRFTRDRTVWEELVQNVFVEAYLSLASYRGRAPLLNWLRRIATRVGYRWWTEQARRQTFAPVSVEACEDVSRDGRAEQDAEEAAVVVHAVLGRMRPRDRLVLTLMYLDQCSVAEIATRTGWSRSMVKVQAHRARKRLKTLLEQTEGER